VIDALMVVSPSTQASINTVLIRIHQCPWINGVFDKGFNRADISVRGGLA
jgi:hypothetical protein